MADNDTLRAQPLHWSPLHPFPPTMQAHARFQTIDGRLKLLVITSAKRVGELRSLTIALLVLEARGLCHLMAGSRISEQSFFTQFCKAINWPFSISWRRACRPLIVAVLFRLASDFPILRPIVHQPQNKGMESTLITYKHLGLDFISYGCTGPPAPTMTCHSTRNVPSLWECLHGHCQVLSSDSIRLILPLPVGWVALSSES